MAARQETRQALRLIARLMRGTPEAAALWIYNTGLSEHQTIQLGALIGSSPFFDAPPRPTGNNRRAKCPECGRWFVYWHKTRRRKWCSDACRMKSKRRQAA